MPYRQPTLNTNISPCSSPPVLQSSSPPVLHSSSPPVTGRSHGLAVAPGHGQVALGTNKVALSGTGPQAGAWCGGPAPLYLPPPPLGHGLAPPPGTPSNWERPINGNVITLDVRKRWGGVGWVGVFCFWKLSFSRIRQKHKSKTTPMRSASKS